MKKRERNESKIDPAPNSNTQKEPDEWVSGDEASYLKTLSEECGEPDAFQPDLTKAAAFSYHSRAFVK
jgi:hypothetical protein